MPRPVALRRRTAESADPVWRVADGVFPFDRPVVIGILNVTPDSFSDGGKFDNATNALAHARALVAEGADLIDVGAESTAPGALPIGAEEEWARLEPVLAGMCGLPIPVSIDTTKAEVAQRALEAGAVVVNDVSGLHFDPEVADVAAAAGAGLILMHMRGDPLTMQRDVEYDDVVREVSEALRGSVERAESRGCRPESLVVDPGLGFGKSAAGNLELLARLDELLPLGRPIHVGPSRKSFIGAALDVPVEERLEGTIAASVIALTRGARLFRVHDVRAARRALDLAQAILDSGPRGDREARAGEGRAVGFDPRGGGE